MSDDSDQLFDQDGQEQDERSGEVLLVLGGYDSNSKKRLSSVLMIDPHSRKADQAVQHFMDLPVPVALTAAVHGPTQVGGQASSKIYLFGGIGPENRVLDTVWELDYDAKHCRQVARLPQPMWGLCAGVLREQIYVAGGHDASHLMLTTSYSFDPVTKTFKELAMMAAPKYYSPLITDELSGSLYAVHTGNTPQVERFSLDTQSWSAVVFLGQDNDEGQPKTRSWARSVKISDRDLLHIGGWDETTVERFTLLYDKDADLMKCSSAPSMSVPRNSPGVAMSGSVIYAAGGVHQASIERLDTAADDPRWEQCDFHLPESRLDFDLITIRPLIGLSERLKQINLNQRFSI